MKYKVLMERLFNSEDSRFLKNSVLTAVAVVLEPEHPN